MSPAKVAAWVESADLVIAADSGLLRVLEAGYIPDIVIGDFDSVSMDMVDQSTQIVVDHGQDNTDCAKLLDFVKGKGYSHVTLICAEGDLSDHFLDTIHCSVRTELNVLIGLERGHAHILKGPVELCIPTEIGKRTSLLPLETITNASLDGVQWSFTGQTLSVRGFTSISNQSTKPCLNISFDEGSAYLFVECDVPQWTVFADQ